MEKISKSRAIAISDHLILVYRLSAKKDIIR